MPRPPTTASADRAAIARAGLPAFVELAGRQRFGRGFVLAKQQRLMAEHAEALYHGDLLKCLVSLPPGSGKSFTLSVCFPAWVWSIDPSYTFMRASYSAATAGKFASDTRALCMSEWFTDRWGEVILPLSCRLRPSGATEYWTIEDGYSLCSSIMQGNFVSRHARLMIIDDPLKAQDAITELPKMLAKTRAWFEQVAITRGAIGDPLRILCAAQRFSVHDLNGLLIERYGHLDTFAHVMLPWHFEPERAFVGKFGRDWRTTEGEELFADPKTRDAVASALVHGKTGSVYRAQYQQDPTNDADAYFPAETLLGFEGAPPFRETMSVISIDPTFAGGPRADMMAIDVWGYHEGHYYCYYSEAVQRDFRDACAAIERVRAIWPVHHVLIEAAANGKAIYDVLQDQIPNFNQITVKGSKEMRAYPVSGLGKSGRLHFDKSQPWWAAKARALVAFPSAGVHDDTVDTMTQAVRWLREKYEGGTTFERSMRELDAQDGAAKREGPPPGSIAAQMAGFATRNRIEAGVDVPLDEQIEALDFPMLEFSL